MQPARTGPILIADITGYSRYLNESELVHAEQTLSALLGLLVEQTRPPMVVSKLEGDAVFSYGLDGTALRGQAFVESLEACYIEFRRALELMVMNTTCRCNACANISALDLKFFVHHGEFVVGESAGRAELHGSDVNLLHRLLKNEVTAGTGVTAYALFTEASVQALGLEALTSGMIRHEESFPDVGPVVAWIEDLAPVWERSKEERTDRLPDDEVLIDVATTIALPIDVVWSYLIDVEYRKVINGADRMELTGLQDGRSLEGSAYQCWHGTRETTQVIVDWRPLRSIATRDTMRMFGALLTFAVEYSLEEVPEGTRLVERSGIAEGPSLATAAMKRLFPRRMTGQLQRQLDAFKEAVEGAHRERVDTSP